MTEENKIQQSPKSDPSRMEELNNDLTYLIQADLKLKKRLQCLVKKIESKEYKTWSDEWRPFFSENISDVLHHYLLEEEICKDILIKLVYILRILDEDKGKKLTKLLNVDTLGEFIADQKANNGLEILFVLLGTGVGAGVYCALMIIFPGSSFLAYTVLLGPITPGVLALLIVKTINNHFYSKKISNLLDNVFDGKEEGKDGTNGKEQGNDVTTCIENPSTLPTTSSPKPLASFFSDARKTFLKSMSENYPDDDDSAAYFFLTDKSF